MSMRSPVISRGVLEASAAGGSRGAGMCVPLPTTAALKETEPTEAGQTLQRVSGQAGTCSLASCPPAQCASRSLEFPSVS